MGRALATALAAGVLALTAGAATPQRGGTVVVTRPALTCLNPFGPCNITSFDSALTQVLEGAFEVGPDLAVRPNLVSRVKIGRKPFTLTYYIRPQARWSDGKQVTAADFGFTYRTFATHRTTADFGAREMYAKIRRFRTLGPKRFAIELREPFADWRSFFDVVLPRHALAGENITAVWRNRIDNPKTGRPIGNGPFLVSRLEPGQLTFVRNPAYWGRHTAYLDRFVFRFGAADAADPLAALRRNETDFVFLNGILAAHAGEARRLAGWRVVSWPGLADEHLVFRAGPGGHPALQSKLVRRALAYAIDRVEIARRVSAELGRRARPLDSTAFLPGESSYRPNWSLYRSDPARARRLLEQAGCRRGGDGIYSCEGQRLRLRFVTTAGSAIREQALQIMVAQLAQVGVEVQPVYAPAPALFNSILPGGDFDAALFSWIFLPGGVAVPESRCGDDQNWAGYCSRLTMRDAQQVDRIVDPVQRARLLNTLDLKLVRDVPILPLFQPVLQAALRQKIRGFVPGGTVVTFAEDSEEWWLAR